MKMIKNTIKLLGIVAVALATLQGYSSAISLSELTVPTGCYDSNESSYVSQKYYTNINRFYSAGTVATNLTMKSKYMSQRGGGSCSAGAMSLIANGVKVSKNGTNFIFQILLNDVNTYNSIVVPEAGLNYQFRSDGQYHLLNNVYVFHDSIVLYDDNFTHTLQFLGGTTIENVVLFTNPLTSATSNGYDNFYLIDFIGKKAYSLNILSQHIPNLFFGYLSDYNIKEFPYTTSYTLTPVSNTSPFPTYNGYYEHANHFTNDTGFLYTIDWEFVAPDFGGGTTDDNSSTDNNNYFNSSLVNSYNSCVSKGENLRKYLQLMGYCYWQSENGTLISDILASNGQYNYTGDLLYCKNLSDFNVNVYSAYINEWNTGGSLNDVNLQDFNAPFNDLVYSRFNNAIVIDTNGNVSGLPNGNDWCTAYTITDFKNSNKSTIELIADEITSSFGTGVAKKYADTINNNSTFSGLIDSIKDGTQGFFSGYLFDPYIQMFNSGYEAFHNKVGVGTCSDIQNGFGGLQLGNYTVYIIGAVIIFILIILL